ncbi:XdhC family protein [Halostella litorea]|uniref:XdhC family protein n=1 Tax=Halostella litorea TaxID=2528831 RepID=UPI00109313D7|nr:XdhC/CoxI family protein [Halostella litorea]
MSEHNWSVPETEVVQHVADSLDAGGPDVLATVVDVEGNAYRRPGAKMLLDADGEGVGSITAGCLEHELLSAADRIRERGRPELVTYDLMEDDEEDVWGLGVGCNGVIEVLLEPLDATYRPAVDAFEAGRDVGVVTVLDAEEGFERGDRAYYYPDEDRLELPDGSPADGWPADRIAGPAADLAERGRSDTLRVESAGLDLFVDGLAAPADLVVFGSGHDVGPVTELAVRNDFRVTVVGFRGGVDLAERFPAADRTVTTSPGSVAADVPLDERTHAVVMTHNFVDDRITVEALLASSAPYVGLMGPRERFERMREAFDGVDESDLDSLYTPVGLDLGGGTPYQIAHSIVAEALAVEHGREPRHLREREGHIHDRAEAGDPAADGVDAEPR